MTARNFTENRSTSLTRYFTSLVVATLFLSGLAPARAQILFTNIANTSANSGFTSFSGAPTVSSGGNIAFTATISNGNTTIFRDSVGGIVSATQATTEGGSFTGINTAVINDSGAIVFDGTTSTGNGTYLVSANGTLSTISSTVSGSLAINSVGTVAIGVPSNNVNIIYKSTNGGSPVQVDSVSTLHTNSNVSGGSFYFNYLSAPAIDGNGAVYYAGSGEEDLYAGIYHDGAQTTSSGVEYGNDYVSQQGQFSNVAVNSSGTLAFYAPAKKYGFLQGTDYSQSGLYIANSLNPVAVLSTYGGAYQSFGAISINNEDEVAYYGTLSNGNSGIYVSALDGASNPNKIISVGDALSSSTVTSLAFVRDGLGDLSGGSTSPLVFEATLANGQSGIYTTSVPKSYFLTSMANAAEPNPCALDLIGVVCLAIVIIRQKVF